jgi:hypothetical protein
MMNIIACFGNTECLSVTPVGVCFVEITRDDAAE